MIELHDADLRSTTNGDDDMKHEDYKLCILTTGGTEGPIYRGQAVYDDGEIAILGHHEAGTEGYEAPKYVLIEKHHRKNVAFYNDLDDFKLACHQNRYCNCHIFPGAKHLCLAEGKGPYTGPTFTSEEMDSLCYFAVYEEDYGYGYDDHFDHENDPDGLLPIQRPYISSACRELRENPAQVQRCVDAIRVAGDSYAHRARRLIPSQKYVGKRFHRFDTSRLVVEHLKVVDYDNENYRYVCITLAADQSETYEKRWLSGSDVKSACDGHNQDRLTKIHAAIQHLSTKGNPPENYSGLL